MGWHPGPVSHNIPSTHPERSRLVSECAWRTRCFKPHSDRLWGVEKRRLLVHSREEGMHASSFQHYMYFLSGSSKSRNSMVFSYL